MHSEMRRKNLPLMKGSALKPFLLCGIRLPETEMRSINLANHHLHDAIKHKPVRGITRSKAILFLDCIPIDSANCGISEEIADIRPCNQERELLIIGHIRLLKDFNRICFIATGRKTVYDAEHLFAILVLEPRAKGACLT